MVNEDGLDDSDKEFEGKETIRNDILALLRKSKYGRNISQISEELNLSRNTVKRYIEILEHDKLIEIKEIGRSRIAYFKSNYSDQIARGYVSYIMEFYNSMLKGFQKIAKEVQDAQKSFKMIGNEMGEHLSWPPLEIVDFGHVNKPDLAQVTDLLIEFLEFFNSIFKIVKVEVIPTIKENTSYNILRIENISDQVEDSEFFYWITMGFFETKLRKIFGELIHLDIMEYQKKNTCAYVKVSIK